MHLSRFRTQFTVRRLMVAVAIIGILLGGTLYGLRLIHLRKKYFDLAEVHKVLESIARPREALEPIGGMELSGEYESSRKEAEADANLQASLKEKYLRAARYPWLSVEPDPPEPR